MSESCSSAAGDGHGAAEAPQRGRAPHFVIIGAARAGTTALWSYLRAHPGAHLPFHKELNFFSDREPSPAAVERYFGHFRDAGPHHVIGEASPLYLHSPHAARRMAAVIPEAKLVVSLREPVARAYSHYWWRRLWRAEHRSFEQAVADEIDGNAPEGGDYLAFSRYHEQLLRFAAHYPREAFHVTLLQDIKNDANAVFAGLCEQLGIDSAIRPPEVGGKVNALKDIRSVRVWRATQRWQLRHNRRVPPLEVVKRLNSRRFVQPPIDDGLKKRLRAYFEGPNAELAAWLGRDLSDWQMEPS